MSTAPRTLVPILALIALGVVLLATWASRRQAGPRTVTAPAPPEAPGREVEEALADAGGDVRRAGAGDVAAVRPAAQSSGPAPAPATGRLRLHVVDAASGAPLPNATCVVYAERGGNTTHGRLTTDADGRAEIGELPENTILVHVLRAPPRASAYAGVWLRPGETRDLEVRVGTGGTITGRVVDDRGRPLADAGVFVPDEEAAGGRLGADRFTSEAGGQPPPEEPDARSGSDGRFELRCVVSRPRGVWIVENAMRPTSWDGVRLGFVLGSAREFASAEIGDGALVDIGDVVLRRPHVQAGRVLDARRNPVARALVGQNSPPALRRQVMDSRDSRVLAEAPRGGAWSRPDGSFEIESTLEVAGLGVATQEGITKFFRVPVPAPGERSDDLELVLDDVTILELELSNEHGERLTQGAAWWDSGIRSYWTLSSAFQASVAWEDGFEIIQQGGADGDGLFRVQTPGSRPAARTLRIELPGYLPVKADLPPSSGVVERHAFRLRPVPTVRVRLKVRAPLGPEADSARFGVFVQACLLGPGEVQLGSRSIRDACCGLGSGFQTELKPLERDIDLPVRSEQERFWLHAFVRNLTWKSQREWKVHILHEQHLGPFAAGLSVHEIEIPALDVPAADETKVEKPTPVREPPPVSFPKNELLGASGPREENAAKTRVRLVESDGTPAPRGTEVRVLLAGKREGAKPVGRVGDGDGRAELTQECRGACLVWVREVRPAAPLEAVSCVQIVAIDAIEATLAQPITLAPWREIEIRVDGAAAEVPGASLDARLRTLDAPDGLEPGWAQLGTAELVPGADGTRRFRAVVAPGKYEITLRSGLFAAPPRTIEVRNTDELQVFRISSTRK